MTDVSPKLIARYPWFIRLFFWKQKRSYGSVLEPKTAHAPSMAPTQATSVPLTGP